MDQRFKDWLINYLKQFPVPLEDETYFLRRLKSHPEQVIEAIAEEIQIIVKQCERELKTQMHISGDASDCREVLDLLNAFYADKLAQIPD